MPKKSKYIPSRTETAVGIVILLVLCLIGTGVYLKQFRYDKTKFNISLAQEQTVIPETPLETHSTPTTSETSPVDFQTMGGKEKFDEKTLSDKIDGKAELYLDCGFKELECQRFISVKDDKSWYEFFVYDMGNGRNAFAVYSNQRRAKVKSSSIAKFAYQTENALFLVHGKYYLEIVASQANPLLMDAMNQAAKNYMTRVSAEPIPLPEFKLLPTENLIKGSEKLYLKNALSFDKLEQVVVANYDMSNNTTMVFVSIRRTPEEAQSLAGDYYKFLINLGGDKVDAGESKVQGLKMVDLLGDSELVFAEGNVLAGIHQAKTPSVGKRLAEILYEKLSQSNNGTANVR